MTPGQLSISPCRPVIRKCLTVERTHSFCIAECHVYEVPDREQEGDDWGAHSEVFSISESVG